MNGPHSNIERVVCSSSTLNSKDDVRTIQYGPSTPTVHCTDDILSSTDVEVCKARTIDPMESEYIVD